MEIQHAVRSEEPAAYIVAPAIQRRTSEETEILRQAAGILEREALARNAMDMVIRPEDTKALLKYRLADRPYEVFVVMFLDTRHRVLPIEEMFRGTVDGACVHPREIVRRAIEHNAAALIVAHQHPSGCPEPSQKDQKITTTIRDALALIDIRLLDHIVVGGNETVSLAERGLI